MFIQKLYLEPEKGRGTVEQRRRELDPDLRGAGHSLDPLNGVAGGGVLRGNVKEDIFAANDGRDGTADRISVGSVGGS